MTKATSYLQRLHSAVGHFFGTPGTRADADRYSSGEPDSEPEPPDDGQPSSAAVIGTLKQTCVADVMVPASDIVAIEENEPLDQVMAMFRKCKHSRLPVYENDLDKPLGFLHLKDLLLNLDGSHADRTSPPGKWLRREVLIVAPTMHAYDLLKDMQRRRIHMALVINEYGGVHGLVTIEDLVEEIVGEIEDEHDPAGSREWWDEKDGVYRCTGRARVEEIERVCGYALVPADSLEDRPETMGGLVILIANRVPAKNDVIQHPDGHRFEILDADPRRIRNLRLRLATADPAPTTGEA